jgi:dihydroorotase
VSAADLAVTGARIVEAGGEREATLLVREGRVAGQVPAGQVVEARLCIDASGCLVMPGLVDAHVHLREPGLTWKEDFDSGTRAAAAGGVTTVLVMPTDDPFTDSVERFEAKRGMAVGRAHVDFALQAAFRAGCDAAGLADAGAVSFEIFLADLPAPYVVADTSALVAALKAIRDAGSVAGITPGEASLHASAARAALGRYGPDRRSHLASRPPQAEALGVAHACLAASLASAEVHVRQVSTAQGLAVLAALAGANVTSEATPHNLLLDEEVLLRIGPLAKIYPPLRATSDVAALRSALAEGRLTMVATDHAPHHPDEKAAGEKDLSKAPGGFPGVQTLLPAMLRLVDEGLIDHRHLAMLCSEAPARRFGLYPKKGHLGTGADADFVVLDPRRPAVVRNVDQLSKAGATPFDGLAVSASIILVCLRGQPVMQNGRVDGPAFGRFLQPTRPAAPAGIRERGA